MANIICINCMKGTLGANGICSVCGKTDEEIKTSRRHLPLRTILRGKYLIGKAIGEGGFGITYLGYDLDLEIRVAVKEFCPRDFAGRDAQDGLTILPFDEDSAEFYDREKEKFINEAKRLAKFRREQGIVSVQDYFQENGTAYIVMEYIDGITLKAFHKMMGKNMEPEKLLNMLKPIMEGLSKLHASGIIHRDISPDNIMIDTSGQQVYLIDFGTAREVNPEEEYSLSVYKKGGYTPIEQQSRHGKQGPWTDVYAFCATIYRCITGTSIPEANNRIMGDKVVRPSDMGIVINPWMEEALFHGLEIKPEERTQSMEELMAELCQDAIKTMPEIQQETLATEQVLCEDVHKEQMPIAERKKVNKGTASKRYAWLFLFVVIVFICVVGAYKNKQHPAAVNYEEIQENNTKDVIEEVKNKDVNNEYTDSEEPVYQEENVSIGILIEDDYEWSEAVTISNELEAAGYDVELTNSSFGDMETRLIVMFMSGTYDAVIVGPDYFINGDEFVDTITEIEASGVPVISYDALVMSNDRISYLENEIKN